MLLERIKQRNEILKFFRNNFVNGKKNKNKERSGKIKVMEWCNWVWGKKEWSNSELKHFPVMCNAL